MESVCDAPVPGAGGGLAGAPLWAGSALICRLNGFDDIRERAPCVDHECALVPEDHGRTASGWTAKWREVSDVKVRWDGMA